MVCVIAFKTVDGFSFIPTSEYDGELDDALHECDSFAR
jgi:hypothetical protein